MVKTITITEEAYKRLKVLKEKDESFTDAIIRISASRVDLSKYAGILTEKEAGKMKNRISELRKESEARLEKIRKELGK